MITFRISYFDFFQENILNALLFRIKSLSLQPQKSNESFAKCAMRSLYLNQ